MFQHLRTILRPAGIRVAGTALVVCAGSSIWVGAAAPPAVDPVREWNLIAAARTLAATPALAPVAQVRAMSIVQVAVHDAVNAITGEFETYQDLGGRYFDERDRQAVERRLVKRLEGLGYKVSLEHATPAA